MKKLVIAAAVATFPIALVGCSTESINKLSDKAMTVHYEITSDGTVDVTETAMVNGSIAQNQQQDVATPYSKDVEISGVGKNMNIMAQAKDGTEVGCTITVDGKEVANQKSSGQYAVVTCLYTP
ncbi:MAG: MmpS family protein [Nocardiaceae bacterium]|nr:MmpS family protein [Nocardiaceae bacterium]